MRKLWRKISYIGVQDSMAFETKRRVILLNRIAITLFLAVTILRTTVIAMGFQAINIKAFIPFFGMLSILFVLYFNLKGYYRFNAVLFSIVTPLCILFFSVMSQAENEVVNINHYYIPRIFILASIVLPLVLIDSKNKWALYSAIVVNFACIISFDHVVSWVGVPFNADTIDFSNQESISKIMVLPALLMVLAVAFLTNLNRKYEKQIIGLNTNLELKNKELGQVNEELISQKDVITEKNAELEQINEEVMTQRDMIVDKNVLLEAASFKVEEVNSQLMDSIFYAETIQRAVLKDEKIPEGWFDDSFIFFKPKSHVSGDFYFYQEFELNKEPCVVIAAVDCTGHGVPGGFLSVLGMTLIKEVLHNEPIKDAADVLNVLRDRVKIALNQTGSDGEHKDGMEMALCIYYPETKIMDYSGARMPLLSVDTSGEVKLLKGDRQPIAIYLKEKEFTNHRIHFKGGEMIYLFSDGIQDQFGGSEGKKLKYSQLQENLIRLSTMNCNDQKLAIDEFVNQWINPVGHMEQEQIDDMLLMGMRV